MQEQVQSVVNEWGRYIRVQLPRAHQPRLGYHCTLIYDPQKDQQLEKKWQGNAAGHQARIRSEYIIVGPEGAAMNVLDTDRSEMLTEWYDLPGMLPHITLMINQGCEAREMGEMLKWMETDNPLVFQTDCGQYMKIRCAISMVGALQEVVVSVKSDHLMLVQEVGTGKQAELTGKMMDRVPEQVWSKHDTE